MAVQQSTFETVKAALTAMDHLLRTELKRWSQSDTGATIDRISNILPALPLLIAALQENNVTRFCLLVTKYKINTKNLSKCFYMRKDTPVDVKTRHNQVMRLFSDVCCVMAGHFAAESDGNAVN